MSLTAEEHLNPDEKKGESSQKDHSHLSHELAYTRWGDFQIDYGREIEQEIVRLQREIEKEPERYKPYTSRWLAIKLLEQDPKLTKQVASNPEGNDLLQSVNSSIEHLNAIFGDEPDTLIADRRYGWIHGLIRETIHIEKPDRRLLSDRIDDIVTNRIIGIPIFLFSMWLVFKFTTDLSAPLLDWVNAVVEGPITRWTLALLGFVGMQGNWVQSLLLDGVIAGVGSILAFIPVLMALYGALAILEDSGYMARAAFVMDRFMHLLGLHGKSFLPLIVGFGCSVPGIFATRTLENEKDRIITGLMVPFMSCGARLPVYVLIAGIFFAEKAGLIVFWMYFIGIAMAIIVGLLLKNTLFQGKQESPFVLELPPYRMPTLRAIWLHMWEHTSSFIRKAGSLILLISLVIWLLLAIPVHKGETFAGAPLENTAYASISNTLAPLLHPAGFGTWQSSGALLSGVAAKEVVVTAMAQVYGMETRAPSGAGTVTEPTSFWADLGQILSGFAQSVLEMIKAIPGMVGIHLSQAEETPQEVIYAPVVRASFERSSGGHADLAAFAFMVFVLIYTPCIATLAALRNELGTRWMLLSAGGQLLVAWLVATLIFQVGKLLGLG
jgi:ferrous iron transport protein B